MTKYEQHELCTFADTLLGFLMYMYKIKDHGSRIAAWLIPVYQETYITTRLHKKKPVSMLFIWENVSGES